MTWLANYKCRIELHDWFVPTADCGTDSYKRVGVRVCNNCQCSESAIFRPLEGIRWIRTKEPRYRWALS